MGRGGEGEGGMAQFYELFVMRLLQTAEHPAKGIVNILSAFITRLFNGFVKLPNGKLR